MTTRVYALSTDRELMELLPAEEFTVVYLDQLQEVPEDGSIRLVATLDGIRRLDMAVSVLVHQWICRKGSVFILRMKNEVLTRAMRQQPGLWHHIQDDLVFDPFDPASLTHLHNYLDPRIWQLSWANALLRYIDRHEDAAMEQMFHGQLDPETVVADDPFLLAAMRQNPACRDELLGNINAYSEDLRRQARDLMEGLMGRMSMGISVTTGPDGEPHITGFGPEGEVVLDDEEAFTRFMMEALTGRRGRGHE